MKKKLLLVRHSMPDIVPGVPACKWTLSDQGRQRCTPLASRLAPWQPQIVVASPEPKASETGRLVASLLDIPFETAAGLHEHERTGTTFTTPERFQAQVAAFFQEPDKLVFGSETADQAGRRFYKAVTTVLTAHSLDAVAIVAHGTVITLFVSQVASIDPFPFWRRLGLPALVVLALPEMSLLAVEENIC
ncbi:MAG: histidine phosphatase family protein [Anaerolineae bacterium]|nr:histidine phosphatase family protein [Anaerolineae bacterium]